MSSLGGKKCLFFFRPRARHSCSTSPLGQREAYHQAIVQSQLRQHSSASQHTSASAPMPFCARFDLSCGTIKSSDALAVLHEQHVHTSNFVRDGSIPPQQLSEVKHKYNTIMPLIRHLRICFLKPVTTQSRDKADRIARLLVEERTALQAYTAQLPKSYADIFEDLFKSLESVHARYEKWIASSISAPKPSQPPGAGVSSGAQPARAAPKS
eukprot:m.404687 g.404687  ORF g.404687 m.404687 type:complete len:211 (-) comp56480_c0_seq7:111-743(-)